jgi:hypothetical protein
MGKVQRARASHICSRERESARASELCLLEVNSCHFCSREQITVFVRVIFCWREQNEQFGSRKQVGPCEQIGMCEQSGSNEQIGSCERVQLAQACLLARARSARTSNLCLSHPLPSHDIVIRFASARSLPAAFPPSPPQAVQREEKRKGGGVGADPRPSRRRNAPCKHSRATEVKRRRRRSDQSLFEKKEADTYC